MSRHRTVRFKCGHERCAEYAHFEIMDRNHAVALQQDYGNGRYRCVRHSQPHEVLSIEQSKIVHEEVSTTRGDDSSNLYWGHSGFSYGPGFKAFANDFPLGTILRVTAEIIPAKLKEGTDGQ